jgi:hypothetical protein
MPILYPLVCTQFRQNEIYRHYQLEESYRSIILKLIRLRNSCGSLIEQRLEGLQSTGTELYTHHFGFSYPGTGTNILSKHPRLVVFGSVKKVAKSFPRIFEVRFLRLRLGLNKPILAQSLHLEQSISARPARMKPGWSSVFGLDMA